jgi:hypothetical protein
MKAEFRLVEMLTIDLKPHPLKIKKGNFLYWNDLCSLLGIDLVEEDLIARQDTGSECSEAESR